MAQENCASERVVLIARSLERSRGTAKRFDVLRWLRMAHWSSSRGLTTLRAVHRRAAYPTGNAAHVEYTPIMSTAAPARHMCIVYDGAPSRMLAAIVASIRRGLDARMRCMYMNSPAMVAGFRSQLYAAGTNVEHELSRGAIVLGSDDDHLVGGRFDVDLMIDMLENAVEQALADGFAGLFATGDMTWEFGPEKDFSKLLDYEWRLEQLFRKQPALSGICQYHRDLLPREAVREGLVSHESVFISDTITRLNPHYVRARSPAEWKVAVRPGIDDELDVLLAAQALTR